MSKTAMWAVGAIVAAALAAGFWISMKSAAPGSTSGVAQNERSSGNLASLVAMGATVQCTVNSSVGGESSSGTVYVSGKKVRGDFTSTMAQAGTMESHMITDGDYVYVWSSAMPQGMKMKATQPEATGGDANQSPAAEFYSKSYDYDCKPWSVDASKFELPKSVTFTDMESMMKGLPMPPVQGQGPAAKMPEGMSCSTCDQAPEAARAQCRQALGCK